MSVSWQFYLYNTALRRYPPDEYDKMVINKNWFSTTIYVLASAIQKLARVEKVPQDQVLYRGLGGDAVLPEHFFGKDENGCNGIVEWGFLSTTSKKEVAIQYSKAVTERPLPIIFEIRTGSVDRGAAIKQFSQYPDEEEYLVVPCSFLEPHGQPVLEVANNGVGIVQKYSVRLNTNLKTATVEELIAQKKDMHLSSFAFLVDEVERELHSLAESPAAIERAKKKSREHYFLKRSLQDLVVKIIDECKQKMERHRCVSASSYLDDNDVFRSLAVEYLELKEMAKSKFNWWLSSSETIDYVQSCDMKTAQRELFMIQAKQIDAQKVEIKKEKDAFELCKKKGLIGSSVHQDINEIIDGETCFLKAAADGKSYADLKLLIQARANAKAQGKGGRSAVYLAAQYGHVQTIRALVELGADVNEARRDGGTPLMAAAKCGDCETVRTLLMLGANVNAAKEQDGSTAIMIAAYHGRCSAILVLVEANADVNALKRDGSTAVISAAENGKGDAIGTLYFLCADINKKKRNGWTAVMAAAENGYCSTIKTLHQLGASLIEAKNDGTTAMIAAVKNRHRNTIHTLLELGVKTDEQVQGNCLVLAAQQDDYETVKLLLQEKASVNARGKDNETAMMAAAANGHTELVKRLFNLEADVQLASDDNWTAVMCASASGHCDIVKFLCSRDGGSADPCVKSKVGFTAVMAAAENGYSDIVEALHECKASLDDHRKDDGSTAAILAALHGHCATIRMLHRLKANIHVAQEVSITAVMAAAQNGKDKTLRTLFELGAQPEQLTAAVFNAAANGHCEAIRTLCDLKANCTAKRPEDGSTAVFEAARNGRTQCLLELHNLGCGIDDTMSDGWTPMMAAAENGHTSTVKKLYDLGATNVNTAKLGQRPLPKLKRMKTNCKIKRVFDVLFLKSFEVVGWTALMSAAKNGHCDTVRTLVLLKADVNAATKDGWTALASAAYSGRDETINTLESLKADVSTRMEDGSTALIYAAEGGHCISIKALLDFRADVNAKNRDGRTALMAAAEFGRLEAVVSLCKSKADVNAKCQAQPNLTCDKSLSKMTAADGNVFVSEVTAIELAAAEREWMTVGALVAFGADTGLTNFLKLEGSAWFKCIKSMHQLGANLNNILDLNSAPPKQKWKFTAGRAICHDEKGLEKKEGTND